MSIESPEPQQRLDRWRERDAAIGLSAEADQLRAAVAERDLQLTDMRERINRLAQQNAQLTQQRDQLANRAHAAARPSTSGRVYRGVRRLVGKVLRRAGLRR
jgi:small-conductance mechanosensitive channel